MPGKLASSDVFVKLTLSQFVMSVLRFLAHSVFPSHHLMLYLEKSRSESSRT